MAVAVAVAVTVALVAAVIALVGRGPAPGAGVPLAAVGTTRPAATIPPTTASPTVPRPPTTTVPPTTAVPPTTTADAAKIAFCAAYEQTKRSSTLPATQYVEVVRTMAVNSLPAYRSAWNEAVAHLEAGLAVRGPNVTGDKLWGAAGPFPPATMNTITNDAYNRCR